MIIYLLIGLLFAIILDNMWHNVLDANPKYQLTIGQRILLILAWPICLLVFITSFMRGRNDRNN